MKDLVRLDSLAPGTRFRVRTGATHEQRGVVVGRGPEGGIVIRIEARGEGRRGPARRLVQHEWSGAVMVTIDGEPPS